MTLNVEAELTDFKETYILNFIIEHHKSSLKPLQFIRVCDYKLIANVGLFLVNNYFRIRMVRNKFIWKIFTAVTNTGCLCFCVINRITSLVS